MLKAILKELNVEVGEEWETKRGRIYKIDNILGLMKLDKGTKEYYTASTADYIQLVTGALTPRWKPKVGEWYYYPEIAYRFSYGANKWLDEGKDQLRYRRGIVCKTPREAQELADKILGRIKEEE